MDPVLTQDKRASERRAIPQMLQVTDARTDTVVGNLVNLSLGGFMLLSKVPLEANEIRHFTLQLPEPVHGRGQVDIKARCVWCHQSSYSTEYGAGFEICHISPDDRRRLNFLYGTL